MDDTVISIKELTKRFKDIDAVNGISLDIGKAEMFAFVGPDGAGKTTLLRMLCGIIEPAGGGASILGLDLVSQIGEIRKHIGYLSQKFSLYGDLSVDENIEFFAEIHGQTEEFEQRRERLLDFTRLTEARGRLADKLSGGMKQKLALTCTLIHSPEIIFLDEPTTGVDPVSRREFWIILSNLVRSGITVVMTTPYLDEAERCTRVGLMNEGKLMAASSPAAIKAMMSGKVLEIICSPARQAYDVLRNHEGIREVQIFGDRLNCVVAEEESGRETVSAVLRSAGLELKSLRVVSPGLENVFISLIEKRGN
ncbi:MAG: ABC transporter ATP-binding protein [Spirochaetales bacterium]|nr:ABC transporter ATP-binding protein [Spirochaetales bacterium]